jgi:hypothetical protein
MEYMLLIGGDVAGVLSATPEQKQQMLGAYNAYTQALQDAGVLKHSARLRPAQAATTVRVRDAKTEVQNGPFAETREELAGYYLIDVPDLDVALNWAKRCPGASFGAVEVRPVWPMTEY